MIDTREHAYASACPGRTAAGHRWSARCARRDARMSRASTRSSPIGCRRARQSEERSTGRRSADRESSGAPPAERTRPGRRVRLLKGALYWRLRCASRPAVRSGARLKRSTSPERGCKPLDRVQRARATVPPTPENSPARIADLERRIQSCRSAREGRAAGQLTQSWRWRSCGAERPAGRLCVQARFRWRPCTTGGRTADPPGRNRRGAPCGRRAGSPTADPAVEAPMRPGTPDVAAPLCSSALTGRAPRRCGELAEPPQTRRA